MTLKTENLHQQLVLSQIFGNFTSSLLWQQFVLMYLVEPIKNTKDNTDKPCRILAPTRWFSRVLVEDSVQQIKDYKGKFAQD